MNSTLCIMLHKESCYPSTIAVLGKIDMIFLCPLVKSWSASPTSRLCICLRCVLACRLGQPAMDNAT